MTYTIIAVVVSILALVLLFIAARLLSNKKWIPGFLRGCLGIILVMLTIVLGLSAKDIASYKAAENAQTIATLSFRNKEANTYQVEIQETSGVFYTNEIEGQQWQLNARMFKWVPLVGAMGFRQGYRLEDIRGRFIELQIDKVMPKREPEQLNRSGTIDVWKILNDSPDSLSSVSAYISTPGFIPVADGAIFDVVLSGQNLTVNPLNDAAKSALKSW